MGQLQEGKMISGASSMSVDAQRPPISTGLKPRPRANWSTMALESEQSLQISTWRGAGGAGLSNPGEQHHLRGMTVILHDSYPCQRSRDVTELNTINSESLLLRLQREMGHSSFGQLWAEHPACCPLHSQSHPSWDILFALPLYQSREGWISVSVSLPFIRKRRERERE